MKFINKNNPYYDSLKNCVKEGIAAEAVIKALDFYLIPFALFLGASTKQIGLLMSIPHLLSTVSMLFAQSFAQYIGARQKVLIMIIGAQSVVLSVLMFLPFFKNNKSIFILILVISLFRAFGAMMGPVWGSLVSHYLSENERGTYFGSRSRYVGIAGLVSSLAWASILSLGKYITESWPFFILFIGVFIARIFSFIFANGMKNIPLDDTTGPKADFNITHLIRNYFPDKNYFKFVFFMVWMTFATQFALPFFNVWLKQELKLNYFWYTSILLSSMIVGLLVYPIWGRRTDTYGSSRVLRLSNILIATIPLLWIIARHPLAIILVECFSGFAWAGFSLSSTNFIYDVCTPENRIRCLVTLNLMNGMAAFLGTLTGGFLTEYLPPLFGYSLLSLFLISSVLRFAGEFFISSKTLKVGRPVPKINSLQLFFTMIGIRTVTGRDPVHEDSF
jgi:MFS family permease